mmetsp:Transcript_12843/g.17509  ORF Transcript_12843/g.17509 Transcript_12843/m.17509 type:complete len:95 (-) Transcript_12843:820-1104(-)
MSSLAINLTVIFGVRLISSQLFNLVLPYYLRYYFKSAERHKDGTTPPELEFLRIKETVVILFSKHFSGDSAESFGSSYHCEHLCDAFLYSRSRG